jgi:hypothetical protein
VTTTPTDGQPQPSEPAETTVPSSTAYDEAAPPQYSADGHWWWTGQQWVPEPAQPQRAAQPVHVVSGGPSFATILGALLVFALIVLAGYGVYDQTRDDQQRDEEYEQLACRQYGYCDNN